MNAAFNKLTVGSTHRLLRDCAVVDGFDGKNGRALTCFATTTRDNVPVLLVELDAIFSIAQVDFAWPNGYRGRYNLLIVFNGLI